MSRHHGRASRGRDDGVTTVEFALVLPLALLILGFLAAVGLYVFWSAMAGDIARDTARQAAISLDGRSYPAAPALSTYAENRLGGVLGTPVSPPAITGVAKEGEDVTVSLTYKVPGMSAMTGLVDVIPGLDLSAFNQVTSTATARRE